MPYLCIMSCGNRRLIVLLTVAVILISGIAIAVHVANHSDDHRKTIAIAWRTNQSSETYVNTCRSVEEAGGKLVRLGQVFFYDLDYDDSGKLIDAVDSIGALSLSAADTVKSNTWHNSNAEEMLKGVDFVIFPGGDDISPSLCRDPQEWEGEDDDRCFDVERDVSDYVLMSYCLDKDIPFVGICRGMQMLSVISGARMIEDIPIYFKGLSVEYHYEHRNQKDSPDAYRDFAPHDMILYKDSMIERIMGSDHLTGCPSWHHQAVRSVENTPLKVTGHTVTDGVDMIESVERTDKKCAFGIQYHPEASVGKYLDDDDNKGDYMDYDSALRLFRWVVNYSA